MKMEKWLNRVICADSLEIMKQLPDKCIDLVLTDPPYGIGESGKSNHSRGCIAKSKEYEDFGWDNKIPSKEYFDEIERISKNAIIFGGNYFTENLKNSSCWLIWDKNNGDNRYADCELAWTNFKTAVRKIKYTWHGMIQDNMRDKEQREHPTQKPAPLFEWILRNYSEEGMTVFN